MTLDFRKLLRNAILREMKIHHFECNVQIFKKEELPLSVTSKIQEVYGETFLGDSNFTIWFSGSNITKEIIEKTIFKIANQALGSAANNMVESDFKTIDLKNDSKAETPDKTIDDVDTLTDVEADKANQQAIANLVGDDTEKTSEDISESVESPTNGEKFVFLKVTMK